ncbi:tRNA-specific adenosine deaminase [Planctomycetota bacterium]|nr:tRNA-specific adenosine deaminase [Planctomycetota bacterium]
MDTDEDWMREALAEAGAAASAGEVPVGALVVSDGVILARGRNAVETLGDPTAHAEMLAIRAACAALPGHGLRAARRLAGCVLVVTLEPCPMCLGAALHARIDRIVFAASEPKFGACGSVVDLRAPPGFNHALTATGGVLADESAALLKAFFRARR